jgi:hypothetical protein
MTEALPVAKVLPLTSFVTLYGNENIPNVSTGTLAEQVKGKSQNVQAGLNKQNEWDPEHLLV